MTWKPEDEVTTTFGTIVQAHEESYNQGWEEAIAMVLDVARHMYNEFDETTLKELEQRIV